MATKTKIKIEIECEDIIDFKTHMSMVRENVIAVMKAPEHLVQSVDSIEFEGINSKHTITITRE